MDELDKLKRMQASIGSLRQLDNETVQAADLVNSSKIASLSPEVNAVAEGTAAADAASTASEVADGANMAGLGVTALKKLGALGPKGSTGDIIGDTTSMILTGASIGGPAGAVVGGAAGLTMGLLGAAASQKERQRKAAAQHYSNIVNIEQEKNARLQSAIQNMGSNIGSTLLSNQKVVL
jgi:gas vesicle protein